jgi:hypothetical protein
MRSAWIVGVFLALVVVALALLSGQRSAAQAADGWLRTVNRYHASVGGSPAAIVVIDTETGQTWTRTPGGGDTWRDLGSPAAGPK